MAVRLQEIVSSLPPIWPEELLPAIQRETAEEAVSVVVLDDDPTGTQTVHDIPVLTRWETQAIEAEFARGTALFYILTNSRSRSRKSAVDLAREIGGNILKASGSTGRGFEIISRSDSTLRGHFPAEVDALAGVLGMEQAVYVIIPFFEEGGRYTINDIHYVEDSGYLTPAAETAFAEDAVFGYRNSDLKLWVEEKTEGRIPASSVQSLSLDDIRRKGPSYIADKTGECRAGGACVVNAVDYRDLEAATLGLLKAQGRGQRFLFRTAASFVRVRAGLGRRPLLRSDEIGGKGDTGGLIVVGSYVPKSSEQLDYLLRHGDVASIEFDVDEYVSQTELGGQIRAIVEFLDDALSQGQDAAVYTSRKLKTGKDHDSTLSIGRQISNGLVDIVRSVGVVPRYVLAKGGITSSDIATGALGIVRAKILGQILPGVPVWRSGAESRFPDMPYVVFPGNVGSADAVLEAVKRFRETED